MDAAARAAEGENEGMNLYFCAYDLQEAGLYVAAESRGKAKRMYCDYCDSLLLDFIAPAGVYDENCEALEAAGVRYCDETEE